MMLHLGAAGSSQPSCDTGLQAPEPGSSSAVIPQAVTASAMSNASFASPNDSGMQRDASMERTRRTSERDSFDGAHGGR
jgi:hypothetical protein